jgi:hypothetical protein
VSDFISKRIWWFVLINNVMFNQRLNKSSQLWIKLNWNQFNLSIVYWLVYWSRWDDWIILKSLHKGILKFASNAKMLPWLKCDCIERSKTRKIDFCASNSVDISDYSISHNASQFASFFIIFCVFTNSNCFMNSLCFWDESIFVMSFVVILAMSR